MCPLNRILISNNKLINNKLTRCLIISTIESELQSDFARLYEIIFFKAKVLRIKKVIGKHFFCICYPSSAISQLPFRSLFRSRCLAFGAFLGREIWLSDSLTPVAMCDICYVRVQATGSCKQG